MVSLILLEVFLEYGIYVMRFFEILTVMTLSSDIPTDMLRFLLGTHCLFANALCNSPYGLNQTQNMSGSVLLTTEASQLSVGTAGEAALCRLETTK